MSVRPLATEPWQASLQKGSRYLRSFFLIALISFLTISLLGLVLNVTNKYPPISMYSYWWNLTDALKCWLAYKLFSYFQRGEWFASAAIRWMQGIAALSLIRGSINIFHSLQHVRWGYFWGTLQPQLQIGHTYHFETLPLPVQSIITTQFFVSQIFGNLAFGCIILFIAWILGEGRKLQEEQALTV